MRGGRRTMYNKGGDVGDCEDQTSPGHSKGEKRLTIPYTAQSTSPLEHTPQVLRRCKHMSVWREGSEQTH